MSRGMNGKSLPADSPETHALERDEKTGTWFSGAITFTQIA
jgi:hypothetical protein